MTGQVSRRTLLALGGTAAAATAITASGLGGGPAGALGLDRALARVRRVYVNQSLRTGGIWNAFISVAGKPVQDYPDDLVEAYSVNKLAVATAVMDKIDRGRLTLDTHVDVTADIISADGDGIFQLDGVYPSSVTIGHVLAALLTISDDTAARLCGLVVPAKEINDTMVAKGFPNTQVQPVANPNRFFLGMTTPRETHDLLSALVHGTLLSAPSSRHLLTLLRSPIAFTDGIRRTMSSDERLRIATKAGWFNDGRNEAGVIFDTAGHPVLIYSMFAHGQSDAGNFGATHPAVQARAIMGREFLDAVDTLPSSDAGLSRTGVTPAHPVPAYRPANGG